MDRESAVVYAVVMIAALVGLDIMFFRHRFWARVMANIGIVLVFVAAFYFGFIRNW